MSKAKLFLAKKLKKKPKKQYPGSIKRRLAKHNNKKYA